MYFLESLKQANIFKDVQWNRKDDRKFPLSDFVNEHSKVKIWVERDDGSYESNRGEFEIKTIDIFSEIF